MESGAWFFLGLTAIGIILMAFSEMRRTGGSGGEEFDDFVERESANVGVTSDVGMAKTLGSMAKTFFRVRNGGKGDDNTKDFDFTADVANQDMVDFWYNPANPMYYAVHSEPDEYKVMHDD